MNQDTQIRRYPDGSIDMSHYLGKGRDCRSRAAFGFVVRGKAAVGRFVGKVAGNRRRGRHLQSTPVEAT